MTPYEKMANAIIERAAQDYRVLLDRLAVHEGRNLPEDMAEDVEELESFFTGSWIMVLSKVEGEALMLRLQRESDELRRKRIREFQYRESEGPDSP